MKPLAVSLPWLDSTWRELMQAHGRDRLPHALLFEGPAGMGKRALALHLGRAVLCRQPLDSGEGCGACASCHSLEAGSHPDLLTLSPEEDKAVIRVDKVRAFCAALALSADNPEGRRVAIIQPAEAMNVAAANSLLKTLEEPVPGRLIVLVSEQSSALLPTIRSRCQRVRFTPPVSEQVAEWLAEAADIPTDEARTLLHLADGAPLAARALVLDETLASRKTAFEQWVALARGHQDPFVVAAEWAGGGMAALRWMVGWLEDLARLSMAPGTRIKNVDRRPILEKMAQHFAPDALLELRDRALEVIRLSPTGVNHQLLLEALLLDWSRLRGNS